jgi:signal transduction histidine kinase
MALRLDQPEANVRALTGLIGWFNQSSVELIEEYRRLDKQAAHLKGELESKRRELEASLCAREEARAYLFSVLQSLKAGVLVLNRQLQPAFFNSRVPELLGTVNSERVRQLLGDKLAGSLQSGDRTFLPLECEKIVHGPGGVMTPVHFVLSLVSPGERQNEYVLVFQDLTTVKRLEAEAARTRRLASLGVMAAEIAHQVRSPLGGIELYASLLKDRSAGEPQRLAGEILKAVQRLFTTLSHLLSFASEPTMSADALAIESLMSDLQADSGPLFIDGRWQFLLESQNALPPVWGDRGLLGQALLNLVINAKEAMPEGGAVEVCARMSPFPTINGQIHKAIEISVSDNGRGISPENRERIFDPFFTTKTNGTGLGLAFTHKIISAHGGSIEIAPVDPHGTRFSVFLAAAEES